MDIALRSVTEDDQAFLRDVYAGTREEELALLPWDDSTKAAFVDHQFAAQSTHYAQHYPAARVDVIVVGGQPAGRLFVDRDDREIRVVDISLLPAFRGLGVGTHLLTAVLEEATRSARSVRIHVERNNPARHLYDRLGFTCVEAGPVYDQLEWRRAVAS